MRKLLLSSSLALLLVGSVAVASADARPWRRGGWGGSYYYSGYPSYSYYGYSRPQVVVPETTYVAPGYTSYYTPQSYYTPGYNGFYYTPGYRGYYGYGGRGYGGRGYGGRGYGWRR